MCIYVYEYKFGTLIPLLLDLCPGLIVALVVLRAVAIEKPIGFWMGLAVHFPQAQIHATCRPDDTRTHFLLAKSHCTICRLIIIHDRRRRLRGNLRGLISLRHSPCHLGSCRGCSLCCWRSLRPITSQPNPCHLDSCRGSLGSWRSLRPRTRQPTTCRSSRTSRRRPSLHGACFGTSGLQALLQQTMRQDMELLGKI